MSLRFAAPRDDGRDVPADIQCSEHNMGFRLNGPFFAEPPFGPDPARCNQPDTPASQRPEVPTSSSAGYSPLYYAAGVPFYDLVKNAPVETRLQAVRLLSVLLGVAAAGFAYLAGFWAFDRRRMLAAATAAVATLQPMASQQFAIVNNDALLIAAGAAAARDGLARHGLDGSAGGPRLPGQAPGSFPGSARPHPALADSPRARMAIPPPPSRALRGAARRSSGAGDRRQPDPPGPGRPPGGPAGNGHLWTSRLCPRVDP